MDRYEEYIDMQHLIQTPAYRQDGARRSGMDLGGLRQPLYVYIRWTLDVEFPREI
jgi:hypothetical protein